MDVKKAGQGHGMDLSGSGLGEVAGHFEGGHGPLGNIKH
jgi:hypothetical protein